MKNLNIIECYIVRNDTETAMKYLKSNILKRKFKIKGVLGAIIPILQKEITEMMYEQQLLFKLQNNVEITDFQTFNNKN